MGHPWRIWLRMWGNFNNEGKAWLERLASEKERNTATAVLTLATAGTGAALMFATYFIACLAIIIALSGMDNDKPFNSLWEFIQMVGICLAMGTAQGAPLGGCFGYSLVQTWRGKRNKAGTICALGGATTMALMALCEYHFLYKPGIPMIHFTMWALIICFPGYLFASLLIGWGIRLLRR